MTINILKHDALDKLQTLIEDCQLKDVVLSSTDIFKVKTISMEEFFVRNGKFYDEIALVVSGILRSFCFLNEQEVTTGFYSTNNFIVDKKAPYPLTSFQALEPTVLLVIEKKTFDELSFQLPKWHTLARMAIETEYRLLENHRNMLSTLTAKERYDKFLADYPELANRIELQYISSYLGITQETLSRVRSRLAKGPNIDFTNYSPN